MNRFFYLKLAFDNIKKNSKTYIPYILTCIFTVAMFYIMRSLSINDGIDTMIGTDTITYTMKFGCWVVAIFALVFLFYTNSFLMKRRKKEFGLFNILGMEKKHLLKVVGIETIYITIISLIVGILSGILLDKAMYLLLLKLLDLEVSLGFYISGNAVILTIILFCAIFFLIFLNSLRQIHLANPIELLKSGNVGEREPKSKWLMTIVGIICLSIAYYISVTTGNPVAAVSLFFLAVILVIVGTYLLFTAGSITLLKLLRKNKKYYYQTKHFISVSGMIYRMKQNAVGLASICILSTMVLVMISSTTSMIVGVDSITQTQYPYDISLTTGGSPNNTTMDIIHSTIQSSEIQIKGEDISSYIAVSAFRNGNTFEIDYDGGNVASEKVWEFYFVTLADYNKLSGENKTLSKGEILSYSSQGSFKHETLQISGQIYNVKERLPNFPKLKLLTDSIFATHFVILEDITELTRLDGLIKSQLKIENSLINTNYGFNLTNTDNKEQQQEFNDKLLANLFDNEQQIKKINLKSESVSGILSIYAGLFFLGIFLGTLFVMATILIIYYKQISEGYDDKERFQIMQKVGMSHAEVKKSIHSQILTVFFLPLVTAGLHVIFAFPIISKILKMLFLDDTALYITCTAICFLVFAILYAIIYSITAKTYYRIVSR